MCVSSRSSPCHCVTIAAALTLATWPRNSWPSCASPIYSSRGSHSHAGVRGRGRVQPQQKTANAKRTFFSYPAAMHGSSGCYLGVDSDSACACVCADWTPHCDSRGSAPARTSFPSRTQRRRRRPMSGRRRGRCHRRSHPRYARSSWSERPCEMPGVAVAGAVAAVCLAARGST